MLLEVKGLFAGHGEALALHDVAVALPEGEGLDGGDEVPADLVGAA